MHIQQRAKIEELRHAIEGLKQIEEAHNEGEYETEQAYERDVKAQERAKGKQYMIHKLQNDVEYCDCLDWNEGAKERQLNTMNVFQRLLHTVGVTLEQREAYYMNEPGYTESKLTKELTRMYIS